jgi:ATP-dependent protease HslVU (ClpYQ) peptidase subunit
MPRPNNMLGLPAAHKAMTIAADVCIYTNHNFTTESLSYGTHPEL